MAATDERRGRGNDGGTTNVSLGKYLASIRSDRGLSLRAVEELTKKHVSNAYLSQIENDKIQQPSPNILLALSDLYEIDFEKLMELAGYLSAADKRANESRHGRVPTFAEHNLTPEEELELMQYLEFMRNRKRSG